MASVTRQLQRTYPLINLTTRIVSGSRQYATTPFHAESALTNQLKSQFGSELNSVCNHAIPNTVALLSYFSAPQSREIPHTARRGTGVFVDPTLLVTSARAVGLASTVYVSDRSAILHNCFIARTIALTVNEEVLRTIPVAVNFDGDVAVLKILNPRKAAIVADLPPPPKLANATAGEGDTVVGLVRHGNCSVLTGSLPGKHRRRKNSGRAKAPWPLDDGLEWVDYGIFEPSDNVVTSLPDVLGSPWFNLRREVVGIASWAAEAEGGCMRSYAVPPARISSVLDYAKTKGPRDPIVMDSWISAHTIPDHNLDIIEENLPHWPRNLIFAIMSH